MMRATEDDFGDQHESLTSKNTCMRLTAGLTPPSATIRARASFRAQYSPQQVPHQRQRSYSLGSVPLPEDERVSLLLPIESMSSHSSENEDSCNRDKDEEQGTNDCTHPCTDSEATITSSLVVAGQSSNKRPPNPFYISLIYGWINAAIVLPVCMSFGAIIYQDPKYHPYLTDLTRLTIISATVHQLCFSTFSSLPFAVGQVQDAGLLFLSSMATAIVHYCADQQLDDDVLLATVTIGLSLATAILGIGLLLVGYFQLAQYVQMLPTPVIGGYLAYIGYFCGKSGILLMAASAGGEEALSKVTLILPGIVCGMCLYISVRQLRHMAVLPSFIVLILVAFHAILWLTGTSIEEATNLGWIRSSGGSTDDDNGEAATTEDAWYHAWEFFQFNKVQWSAFPSLLLTEVSMIFVVALSSSLDVAAIELEYRDEPLNYNHEIRMVGLSNVVSGLTGGYTGSYIFSQSIFCLRAGITSPAAGYILAATEFLVLVLPFNVFAYIPNFFFASLLIMIAIDLMVEWLWEVREKVGHTTEYILCLATFVCIQTGLGVELGIVAGIVLYLLAKWVGLLRDGEESGDEGPGDGAATADAAADTTGERDISETSNETAQLNIKRRDGDGKQLLGTKGVYGSIA